MAVCTGITGRRRPGYRKYHWRGRVGRLGCRMVHGFAARFPRGLFPGLGQVCPLLVLIWVGPAGAADWAGLAPGEFARRPELQARIDVADFDAALLGAAIFHESNRVRVRLGLEPFHHLPQLDEAADLKAAIGVLQAELVHENPLPFTASPADRVRAVGVDYRQVAENLVRLALFDVPVGTREVRVREREGRQEYYDLRTNEPVRARTYADQARVIVEAWMNSPPHRANLVNPALTALGCAARPCRSLVQRHEQVYAVQVFVLPR